MTELCRICRKQYNKIADFDKLLPYIPSVCSDVCFEKFIGDYPEVGRMVTAKYVHNKRLKETRSKAEDKMLAWFDSFEFDALYEPYYVQLDKKRYLPDIYLPDFDLFVEVKNGLLEAGAFSKISTSAQRINLIVVDGHFLKRINSSKAYSEMQERTGGFDEKRGYIRR